MLLDKLIPSVMITVGLVGVTSVTANSNDRSLNESPEAGRVIDGSIEPEKIYDYYKYGSLIRGYELQVRGGLAEKLSFEDQEILRNLAVRDPIEQAAISDRYKQARSHLCANRGNMTPVEIAKEWSRIALEWRLKNEARYRKGIESLSALGRQIVEEYIAAEIVPRIRMGVSKDAVEIAREDPEGFMEGVEEECYFAENHQLPPERQQLYDEFLKTIEEQERPAKTENNTLLEKFE